MPDSNATANDGRGRGGRGHSAYTDLVGMYTHPSIEENAEEEEVALSTPTMKRCGLRSADTVRSSCLRKPQLMYTSAPTDPLPASEEYTDQPIVHSPAEFASIE